MECLFQRRPAWTAPCLADRPGFTYHSRSEQRQGSGNEGSRERSRWPCCGRTRDSGTMSRSTNAVLLSALLAPGAGHLYLKQYPRGIALIVVSLACLWVVVDRAMQQASLVLERLASEGGAIDPGRISDLVTQASKGPDSLAVSVATAVLAICWAIGIVDAYRLGKDQQGRNAPCRNPAKS